MDVSSNKLKKIGRKLKKLQHIVFKETGISCSLEPEKNLVICNSGLVNGLSEETIFEHFSPFGVLENIILLPGKSCSFLNFKELSSAVKAFEHCNAKLNIAQDNKPIYILFAERLPADTELSKIWNEIPEGLVLIKDFINVEEENKLLQLCDVTNRSSEMKHRQVKHYGYEFRYDINNVDKQTPLKESIPNECFGLFEKLKDTKFSSFYPDQLTINHYQPGQGIPNHVDTHSAFEDPILSLSLQSQVVMEFKKGNQKVCILLPRRSLLIMSGESRYDWTHGITPRKFDIIKTENGFTTFERNTRISFTFRKVLQGECFCNYKTLCDSFLKETVEDPVANSEAAELEKLHVHSVYENIAPHFSDTRHKPWPNVLSFVKNFDIGSILVDIGCGNGKYLDQNTNIIEIGCDTSFGLLEICRKKGLEAFASNCLNLPVVDNIADGVISIAVIHHLSTEERRLQAIKEIIRVLKVGGTALIYVWAKDQFKDKQKTSYIKQDRKNRREKEILTIPEDQIEKVSISSSVALPVHINRTQFKHKDLLVPWKLKTENEIDATFLRYYHVFDDKELEQLCGKLNNVEIVNSYYDQGNWCAVIKKK